MDDLTIVSLVILAVFLGAALYVYVAHDRKFTRKE